MDVPHRNNVHACMCNYMYTYPPLYLHADVGSMSYQQLQYVRMSIPSSHQEGNLVSWTTGRYLCTGGRE